ncbi:hypothetical protein B0H13DRAFT_1915741 [Mycena leptocephala]|nr:hypothetical protein B0H13DRAFT_1915741 [Mycena leptocephala]
MPSTAIPALILAIDGNPSPCEIRAGAVRISAVPINIPPSELGDLDPISEPAIGEPAIGDGDEIETVRTPHFCLNQSVKLWVVATLFRHACPHAPYLGLLRHIACNQTHTAFRRIFTQQHATLENLDPMSGPSFGDCDKIETDTQLFIDNKAGLINSTFKFECFNGFSNPSVQKGPAFSLCGFGDYPNLCIGGNKGQHACGGPKCQFIDWTKARAQGCAAGGSRRPMLQLGRLLHSEQPTNRAVYMRHLADVVSLCKRWCGGRMRGPEGEHHLFRKFLCSGRPAQWDVWLGSITDGFQWKWEPIGKPSALYLSHNRDLRRWCCVAFNLRRSSEEEKNTSDGAPVPVQPVQEVVTVQMTEYHVRAHSGYYT